MVLAFIRYWGHKLLLWPRSLLFSESNCWLEKWGALKERVQTHQIVCFSISCFLLSRALTLCHRFWLAGLSRVVEFWLFRLGKRQQSSGKESPAIRQFKEMIMCSTVQIGIFEAAELSLLFYSWVEDESKQAILPGAGQSECFPCSWSFSWLFGNESKSFPCSWSFSWLFGNESKRFIVRWWPQWSISVGRCSSCGFPFQRR